MKSNITVEKLASMIAEAEENISKLVLQSEDTYREERALGSLLAAKKMLENGISRLKDDHSEDSEWKNVTIMVMENGGLKEAAMFVSGTIHSINLIRIRQSGEVALSRVGVLTAMRQYPTPEAFLEASGRKDVTLLGTIEI